MTTVKLGFIGYGIMGERLLRATLAHDRNVIAVAGAWDPSPAALERLGRDLPQVPRLRSAQALIEASDCVYIASPPASHVGYATRAMEAGRAVFCEKPLAVDLASAQAFIAATEAQGGRAAVNFPFASSFAVDRLRAWMQEGVVGTREALTIDVAFAAWPRPWQADAAAWLDGREEGGFTREVVSHFLFLTRRLLGPLVLQDKTVRYPDAQRSERGITARLEAGPVPVTLNGAVGETDMADHNLWTLTGSAGAIRLRDWSVAERLDQAGRWIADPDALTNEETRPLVLRRQLDKVAAMTRGLAHDLATLREALDVQGIVETILKD